VKKWNHYKCLKCGGVTVARHDDEGVTPFIIRCRAKDENHPNARVRGCTGHAESSFFSGSQDDNQKPHVIFYRPSHEQAMADIAKEPIRDQKWLIDHYLKGGSLMKECNERNNP